MSIKLLSTADIHIGRQPTRVSDPENARRFSCARVWQSIVEYAIREKVDLVTLSGDIVDHNNRFFEATGPLEAGLAKLAAVGIHTYAVSGNHDYDVLPRISEAVGTDFFHLLGLNGQWEHRDFERDGQAQLRIHGWSFPASHVTTNPLSDWEPPDNDGLPAVGLLHADLDVADSRYAPVLKRDLESRNLLAWLLGHVHRPQLHNESNRPLILYPGSPQAMDPGEPGKHGIWLIEIHNRHEINARQIALSKVRYEELDVDLSDIVTKEQFDAHLISETGSFLEEIVADSGPVELLSLRISLGGRTSICGNVDEFAGPLREDFERTSGAVTAQIDKVTNKTLPAIDLEVVAQKHDPPGVLAQTLLNLRSGEPDERVAELIQDAHRNHREVFHANAYSSLSSDPEPDLEMTRQRLLRQGMLLLDRLLAQEDPA